MRMGRIRGRVKQIVTAVNDKEYAELAAYARRKKVSIYTLLKTALREYVERHP